MNTQSNAMHESSLESQAVAPVMVISPARRLYWSVRREVWENRYLYIAPLGVAAVLVSAYLIGLIFLPHHRMPAVMALDPTKRQGEIALPHDMVEGLIMATAFFIGLFYCLEALHGERRDRSILFWKSLPVSDLTTVLAKASIPVILLLLSFVIIVVTQFIILLMSTLALLGSGNVATLWTQVALPQKWLMLLYHLVTVHALWYAPIYGWLLLVSAWARRAPFLWAVLPPLWIGFAEIAFNTTHFAHWVAYRFSGPEAFSFSGPPGLSAGASGMAATGMAYDPGKFFSTPGLWIGLAVAAGFIYAAARVRRYRGPI
jgi:ABC-2 type transport system permease protein